MLETPRRRILRAATDLLVERGIVETSLRTVAARAGCTTGSVTHHFPTRQVLLVAMLRTAHEAAAARMLQRARRETGARERLRAVLEEALPLDARRMREWKVWLAFWAEASHDPAIAAENEARLGEWHALLEALVQPLVRTPRDRNDAVGDLVVRVDGLGLGMASRGRRAPTREQLRASHSRLDDWFITWVRVSPERRRRRRAR